MTHDEHKKLGITFFNKTWDYIDKEDRSEQDNLDMINYAHASLLHWQLSECPPLNIQRGQWQLANVYSHLNMGESALKWALACYTVTIQNNIKDFDLVFAHQMMAKANQIIGNTVEMEKHLELGYAALEGVEKTDDRDYCKSELDKIKKEA